MLLNFESICIRANLSTSPMNKTLMLLMLLSGCSVATKYTRPNGLEVVTITLDSSNAHLVKENGNAILVDAGYEANASKLEDEVRRAGIDPSTQLKGIVVTHGHADHAGGARYFQQKFKVPVFVGLNDETMFSTGKNEPLCPVGFIANTRHQQDESATYTGSTADVLVEDVLDLKATTGIDAKVRRLPGHTRGSVIVTAGDVVLVGDLFRGSVIGTGAETHFFMCDVEGNRRDVMKLLSEVTADTFFVGHFGPVTRASVQQHFGLH